MDTGLLILLIAVAGYLLIADLLHTRYRIPRWSGYHLLFVSFAVGVPLLWLALELHAALSSLFSLLPQFAWMERHLQDITSIGGRDYAKHLSIALSSFAMALLIPKVHELWVDDKDGSVRDRHIREAAEARGSFMEIALMEAMRSQEEEVRLGVELLLENDMVYMGIVMESGITVAEGNSDIKLMWIHRGYWDKNNGKFVTVETRAGSKPEDYPVVTIPIRRIVSVCKVRLG